MLGQIPGLTMAPGMAQMMAANAAYGLPFQNLGMLEGLTVPIAGLGGQNAGTSAGTTTQQSPWWTTALGGGLLGASLLGGNRNGQ